MQTRALLPINITAVLILLCTGASQYANDIEKTKWLIGTWENRTPKGSIYESWNSANESELSGKSYAIKDRDTLVFETIRVVQEKGELFYIPTVKNQNDGLPIRFSATTISETQLIFENLVHDFPQIISYTRITTDSLVAEISGTKNGQVRKQTFPMKRVR